MVSSKHGWKWASDQALDTYRLILMENSFSSHGPHNGEDILYRVGLADEIVRLEGRIPSSFQVAVDLGAIYSAAAYAAAAAKNAHQEKTIDEFVARAHEAWCIASTHLQDGGPADAATESTSLKALYRGAYFQIPCEIGFAKYLRSNGMDVGSLLAVKRHWLRARQEAPDNPILRAIGAELDKAEAIAEQTVKVPEPSSSPPETASRDRPRRDARPRRLQTAAIASALIVAVGVLAYGYRTLDRGTELNAVANSMDRSSDVPLSTVRDAPLAIALVDAQSTDVDSGTTLNIGSKAEPSDQAAPSPEQPEPQPQYSNDNPEKQPVHIADSVSEIASQTPASAGAPTPQPRSGALERAARFERLAFQALVAGDFREAQKLFRASENASHGYHFSYEWTRLLAARRNDLKTANGRKAVLRYALSKDYVKYAPTDVRDKLRELAQ